MPTNATLEAFIARVEANAHVEAIRDFYAEHATMRENFLKGGTGYGDFKKQLFEKLWEYFAPMRKRREEVLADQSYIDNILETGAAGANEIAGQVMKRVREAVGLR